MGITWRFCFTSGARYVGVIHISLNGLFIKKVHPYSNNMSLNSMVIDENWKQID